MDPKEMLDSLIKQADDLRQDLIQSEQSFTQKKEQFIRLQGAIEALTLVTQQKDSTPETLSENDEF